MADDLSGIPTGLLKTFEFTKDDHSRIILSETLFDSTTVSTHADTDSMVKSLKSLTVRETKQHLHAVSLSDYLRNKIIPRGLRIQNKTPALGLGSPEFLDRWCEILNKCSMDLMALIIQETSELLIKTREEITLTRGRLDALCTDKNVFLNINREIEQLKEKTYKEVVSRKRDKFTKNVHDYKRENVYFWRKPAAQDDAAPTDGTATPASTTAPQHGHQQGLPPRPSPSSWLSSSSFESDSGRRAPFLGEPPRRRREKGRGPSRGRGRYDNRATQLATDESDGGNARPTRHHNTRSHRTR